MIVVVLGVVASAAFCAGGSGFNARCGAVVGDALGSSRSLVAPFFTRCLPRRSSPCFPRQAGRQTRLFPQGKQSQL